MRASTSSASKPTLTCFASQAGSGELGTAYFSGFAVVEEVIVEAGDGEFVGRDGAKLGVQRSDHGTVFARFHVLQETSTIIHNSCQI